jgi:beta-glucosidase
MSETRRELKSKVRLHLDNWPIVHSPTPINMQTELWIDAVLSTMTLAQKVGQVVQADIPSVTPEEVAEYHLGSVLNGGNSSPGGRIRAAPEEWLALADAYWLASFREDGTGIPVIWGTDAVHGHNNVVGATIFPHNIGLGAANDENLVERIGRVTAVEMRATGIEWTFAPTLAVTRDDRWGRTYESYSEIPEIVANLGAALVRGLQGDPASEEFLGPDHVVATAKHFLGDGGTTGGRDQGETEGTESDLRDIHAPGYVSAIQFGVQTVMASYSSWQGQKMHGFTDAMTGLLKGRWNFDGFIVGDWNAHGQLEGCTETDCPDALLAGLDMYMAPDSWKGLIETLTRQVGDGTIPIARLDDAVRRILRVKKRLGLFDQPRPSHRKWAGEFNMLGCEAHSALADEAVRKSSVLLKNANGLLPLYPEQRVLVVGEAADDIGAACGGWSLSWQGGGLQKAEYPHAETLLVGVKRIVGQASGTVEYSADGRFNSLPDVAIVVFGEEPYAEFRGDLETLDFCPGETREAEQMRRFRDAGIPVVAVFYSGRPLWVNPELNASDAFIAAFLPGTRAGALADQIFADRSGLALHDFTGRLSFSWPRDADQYRLNPGDADYDPLFPLGSGLSLGDPCALEQLHEEGLKASADRLRIFDQGRLVGSWALMLEGDAGLFAWDPGRPLAPGSPILTRLVDHGRQENALSLEWSEAGAAVFGHDPMDMTRESVGDFHLSVHFMADAAITNRLKVSLLSEQGETSVTGAGLTLSSDGNEHHMYISLKNAPGLGADLTDFTGLRLELDQPGILILTRIVFEMITT